MDEPLRRLLGDPRQGEDALGVGLGDLLAPPSTFPMPVTTATAEVFTELMSAERAPPLSDQKGASLAQTLSQTCLASRQATLRSTVQHGAKRKQAGVMNVFDFP